LTAVRRDVLNPVASLGANKTVWLVPAVAIRTFSRRSVLKPLARSGRNVIVGLMPSEAVFTLLRRSVLKPAISFGETVTTSFSLIGFNSSFVSVLNELLRRGLRVILALPALYAGHSAMWH